MKARARNPIAALLALISILLSASATLAEDYSVDFGADTDRGRDAGTLHCQFGKSCEGKMESLGLGVSLLISRSDPTSARVSLSGDDTTCCYFAYARDAITIYARTPLSRLPIFKGAGAKGGLFVQNEPAGTLYLRLRFP